MSDETSDDRSEPGQPAAGGDADQGKEAASPFDHPAFMPVILAGMALWSGRDGWFNEEIESVLFNRYGFGFLLGAFVYFTVDEFTRHRKDALRRYQFAILCLCYATWLGAFAFLGSPGNWYNEEPWPQNFNRFAGMGFLAVAAMSALRGFLRGKKQSTPD